MSYYFIENNNWVYLVWRWLDLLKIPILIAFRKMLFILKFVFTLRDPPALKYFMDYPRVHILREKISNKQQKNYTTLNVLSNPDIRPLSPTFIFLKYNLQLVFYSIKFVSH
jgi:hypothetical protein